ncbi:MAG TPA: hypothetical protein VH764_05125 [Gemmatimonadales bacterium]
MATAWSPAAAQAPAAAPPAIGVTPQNARINNYLRDLAGPPTFVRVVGGSVLSHLRGNDKLGSEIASRFGQMAIETSVQHGLAAVMQHSTDYQPCDCRGFGNKVGHALVETFTDRLPDGSRAIAVPRMVGAYAGGFARLAWDHDRGGAQDVLMNTTLSFGLTAVFNIARELTGVGR